MLINKMHLFSPNSTSFFSINKFRVNPKIAELKTNTTYTDCPSYVDYNFQSSGNKSVNKRRYREVVEVIGDIGGVTEFLKYFFLGCYLYYNHLSRDNFLFRSVFTFVEDFEKKYLKKHDSVMKRRWITNDSFFGKLLCCWRKRTPEDSELDGNKTLFDLWNHIRICDNNRYPAYFIYNNKKIILKYEVI